MTGSPVYAIRRDETVQIEKSEKAQQAQKGLRIHCTSLLGRNRGLAMTHEAHPLDAVFTLPGSSVLPKRQMRLRVSPLACGAVRVTRTLRDRFLDTKSDVVTGGEPVFIVYTGEETRVRL